MQEAASIFQDQPIHYSLATIAQSTQWYEKQLHTALQICRSILRGKAPDKDEIGCRRTSFLRERLSTETFSWETFEETLLRGTLLEIVAQQALDAIAQRFMKNSPYRVIFAPPTIFDASTQNKKGGDLLFVKMDECGDYKAISLLDVTVYSKSRRDLRTATHDGLGKESMLPVIVVNMGDMEWEDVFGKTRETRQFLQTTVRKLFRAGITEYPFYGVHPEAVDTVLAKIMNRIEAGCQRSHGHIHERRRLPERQLLLDAILETCVVLGQTQHKELA